jgi:hypothetical protein
MQDLSFQNDGDEGSYLPGYKAVQSVESQPPSNRLHSVISQKVKLFI